MLNSLDRAILEVTGASDGEAGSWLVAVLLATGVLGALLLPLVAFVR